MNETKYLVYQYSPKNESWFDATELVEWVHDAGNSWLVKYNNKNEPHHVSYRKLDYYDKPEEIEFAELFYKDSPCYKVKRLIYFNDEKYKIFYESGYTCVADPSEIRIVKDLLKIDDRAQGVMAYYRRVVHETAFTEEDTFLAQQFDDIDYVNQESVLSLYLKGSLSTSSEKSKHPIICPFGTNLSQSDALSMIFDNRISIIEGPPGTGKTQTILNFIANALVNKKSIAVVSNNNSATDNVYEKLDTAGYSFIAAPLGNADNVDKFFEEYDTEIPTFIKKKVDVDKLNNLHDFLHSYYENENNKRKAVELLKDFELEYKHFLSDNSEVDFEKVKLKPKKVKSANVMAAVARLTESDEKLNFWAKLSLRLKLKVNKSFFELDTTESISYLYNLFYLSRINEIKKEIKGYEKLMNNQTLKEKTDEYKYLSKLYFENALTTLFADNTRGSYQRDNYKRQFAEFVRDYPVILSSTYSLAKCSQRGFLFDYLIVDESSQVNMASAILSMRVAKNIVVVGDIKQLPQIDNDSFKERNEKLLKLFNVPHEYSYYGNSIMSSLLSLYGDKIPKTMLKEHYRCNPDIISFCNKKFYNDELIVYTEPKTSDYSMKVIKTVPGNFARKNPEGSGLYNQREIDEIQQLLSKEQFEDVGVIAPYRYHTEKVANQLGDKVDASTIHKFQGREKKTIIFSSVVNDSNDFVENDNLINVAVSRAIDKFILVTSDKVFKSKSGVLSDLVNYITYNNDFGQTEEGTVKSIYDLLYGEYQNPLIKFRSKNPSNDFDSENLTKELINRILEDKDYSGFGFRMHVSLRDFVRSNGLHLSDEEYKFYRNPNAHADFLVYNKMSRKPVLVIEVDGVSFHEQQKVQQERDAKKNSILEKAGIPILRLKTNESNEETRIRDALRACL